MIELHKKNESDTNEIVAKSSLLLFAFVLLIGILCWIGVFSIQQSIINYLILASTIPLMLPLLLVHILHINKNWVKYVIITCIVIGTGISYAILTFQTVMIFILPSIIATFYLDIKVTVYTAIINVINIILAHVFTGFYLFQPWVEPFSELKEIMLYGALPRVMQYLMCAFLLYVLCRYFIKVFNGFDRILKEERKSLEVYAPKQTSDKTELNQILEQLTEREKNVFELLVQGYTNAQISNQLYLSNGTVKNYVSVIYDKIGTKDRTALILRYSPFYQANDCSHD